jgi:hypothetical protein
MKGKKLETYKSGATVGIQIVAAGSSGFKNPRPLNQDLDLKADQRASLCSMTGSSASPVETSPN